MLFFYPADFTFICPTEIQEFSRRYEEFRAVNCEVLGASTDSKHSHKAWIKNGLGKLNHPLLADFNKTIARDYEALLDDGVACRGDDHHRSERRRAARRRYNADLLGRSVSETLRLVQALQTGERCPVEWKPGAKTLGKPRSRTFSFDGASVYARAVGMVPRRLAALAVRGLRGAVVLCRPRRRASGPQVSTLFDAQALYAGGAEPRYALAAGVGLPGGVALGGCSRRTGSRWRRSGR